MNLFAHIVNNIVNKHCYSNIKSIFDIVDNIFFVVYNIFWTFTMLTTTL